MGVTMTEIWEQVQAGLRSFIARRVEDQAAVDDILQDVFIRMYRQMAGLKDPKKVVSWVYQITRNAIVDHYRSAGRRREIPVGLADDFDQHVHAVGLGGTEADSPSGELSSCLRPMLEQLSNDYREAVEMVELEGLTQQAAATRLGLSLSGMKSRVQRGRKQLKEMLEQCCAIHLDRRRGVIDFQARDGRGDHCRPGSGKGCP
jgi:RNA polymerase sigma-70 factor (ECF subfamily)